MPKVTVTFRMSRRAWRELAYITWQIRVEFGRVLAIRHLYRALPGVSLLSCMDAMNTLEQVQWPEPGDPTVGRAKRV